MWEGTVMAPTREVAAVRGRAKKQASMLRICRSRDADSSRPSAADDQAVRGCRVAGTVAAVRRDVRRRRPGRASIPPERLLKASLLISLYSVRSERAFCEELTYHLLFRWFRDMDMVEPSFDPQHVFEEPTTAVAPPRQP